MAAPTKCVRGERACFVLTNSDQSDWVPEIHGLFGIFGELTLTLIEAQAEVVLLRDALGSDRSAPVEAALWQSLRFFLEAQADTIIVFCHTVANLTARTLALDSGFNRVRLDKPNRRFVPGATHASAWFSLDSELLKLLCAAAVGASPAGSALVHTLSDLLNGPWGDLNDLRKVQYHRWRGESPGVTGVNSATESMRARIARGEGIEMGGKAGAVHRGACCVEQPHRKGVSVCRAAGCVDGSVPRALDRSIRRGAVSAVVSSLPGGD